MINFLFQEFRMCKLTCHVTVIGKKKHTCCVTVKATYRIDTFRTGIFNQIHNSLTLLRIITCSNIILWLVQQHIHFLLDRYRLIVELNFICTQNLCTEFCNDIAVNKNDSGCYEFICFTTAAYTCIGKELVKTYRLTRVDILLLIFNTFLNAVFCIWIVIVRMLTIVIIVTTAVVVIAAAMMITTLAWLITCIIIATFTVIVITWAITVVVTLLISAALLITALAWLIACIIITTFTVIVITWAITVVVTLLITTALLITATLLITTTLVTTFTVVITWAIWTLGIVAL